jgi:hypothetical protein
MVTLFRRGITTPLLSRAVGGGLWERPAKILPTRHFAREAASPSLHGLSRKNGGRKGSSRTVISPVETWLRMVLPPLVPPYSTGALPSRSYSALNSHPSSAIAATRYIHTSNAMLAPILPYIRL